MAGQVNRTPRDHLVNLAPRVQPITRQSRDRMLNCPRKIKSKLRDQSIDASRKKLNILPQQILGNAYLQQNIRFKYRPTLFGKYVDYEIGPYVYLPKEKPTKVVKETSVEHQRKDIKISHVANIEHDVVVKIQSSRLQHRLLGHRNDAAELDTCRPETSIKIDTNRSISTGSKIRRIHQRKSCASQRRQRRRSFKL